MAARAIRRGSLDPLRIALAEAPGEREVFGRGVDGHRGAFRGQRTRGRVRGPRHAAWCETVLVVVDEPYFEAPVGEGVLRVVVVVGRYVRHGHHLRIARSLLFL